MLSLTFFTLLFIIIVAMASTEPWKIPLKNRKTRDLTKIAGDRNYDCLYTYTAFQPNMDFFKEKVVEMTVNKCRDAKGGNKRRRRNQTKGEKGKKEIKSKGHSRKKIKTVKVPKSGGKKKVARQNRKNKKNGRNKQRGKRNRQRQKTKSRRMPKRKKVKKNKKVYRDLQQFQDWKRMMSQRRLMTEPVAKDAVASLWSGLMETGGEWKVVFEEMHHPNSSQVMS